MTRQEATETLAGYRAEHWDNNDTENALIEGRIGFSEMSNAELAEWMEEWLEQVVTIEGTEPPPLRVQYAATDLLAALKMILKTHDPIETDEIMEDAREQARAAIAKAEGRA